MENETKNYEDLEFQHLEEEAEWSAYHEELHHDLQTLTKMVTEKAKHVAALQNQGIDNQRTACVDSRVLESDICKLQSELVAKQGILHQIDQSIFELTGQKDTYSESEDEEEIDFKPPHTMLEAISIEHMSQSLFGSHENLRTKPKSVDIMSRSVNENMFYENNIESRTPFSSTPKRGERRSDFNNIAVKPEATNEDATSGANSITMLKYNLSPPFQHKLPISSETSSDEANRRAKLNLSIESDDFEVNPLEKRVPSQDDIDRISKVTFDAPISMQGASFKVIESIKEIERNRQLLLAQQGLC